MTRVGAEIDDSGSRVRSPVRASWFCAAEVPSAGHVATYELSSGVLVEAALSAREHAGVADLVAMTDSASVQSTRAVDTNRPNSSVGAARAIELAVEVAAGLRRSPQRAEVRG